MQRKVGSCVKKKQPERGITMKTINVEHEENSTVIWIDRESLTDGTPRANFVTIAPWGDADALVRAAKVIFRLAWN